MRCVKLVLVFLALSHVSSAQELPLRWEFDAAYQPAPTSFLFTVWSSTDPGTLTQFRVANAGRDSCAALEQTEDIVTDTLCGRTPGCYTPGYYSFWAQAEWPGASLSAASNVASCEVKADCAYDCRDVTLPPEIQALVAQVTASGATSVDADAAAAVVKALVPQTETASTTPPATVAEAVDQITPALHALAPHP